MEYTAVEILNELSHLGDEKRIVYNKKSGVTGEQFGVTLGKLRDLAKRIKKNHSLAIELWESKNFDAMILASMLFESDKLTESDIYKLSKIF